MSKETMTAWVARDEDGELCIGTTPPIKQGNVWVGFAEYMQLDKSRFPQVQWSDEEPTEVEITIKTKSNDKRN